MLAGPSKSSLRELTRQDLERFLASPLPPQDLIVRVLETRRDPARAGAAQVQLEPVEWHTAVYGPIWVPLVEVVEKGPAEQFKTAGRERWREEYAGCLRVAIPWEIWREHMVAAAARAAAASRVA